jgi:hypothetical protein
MPNIYPFQGAETRLVRETSYGTTPGSPAWKRLNGFGVTISPTVENDPFAPPGSMVPSLVQINDDFTEGSVEGRLDYNGLAYIFAGLFGQPTITDLGGSPNAYQWDWIWNGRRPLRPVSYTVHYGFSDSTDVVTGWIFNTLEISGGRSDGFDVSGEGFGKAATAGSAMGGVTNEVQTLTGTALSAGSFTLTFNGEETATITYNATAGAIQTALEALPSIEPGDIVVAGGPINTTPVTVTFGGPYAGANQPMLIETGLTGTIAITETTPGADSTTDVSAVPANATQGNVYLDTTWAGLGSTQLLYAYEMGLTFGERMERVRPINKSKSSDGVIDMSDQEHEITLMLGRNAVADAQLTKLRNGTRSFVRAEWEGGAISGANEYLFQTDACVIYTEVGEPDDIDGVHAREYTGRLAIDPTSGYVCRIKLVNDIGSL